jgi:YwiC-like protein
MSAAPPAAPVRLRSLALPAEHGSWGLLLEPIVLGLVLCPTATGAWLSVAAAGAFLARHPLKLFLGDRRRGTVAPRTAVAVRVAFAYSALALAAFGTALASAPSSVWIPVLLASPLAAFAVIRDAAGQSRDVAAELSGAVALAASAGAIALAGGWSLTAALLLWLVLAARDATAILYVRARIRLDRGVPTGTRLVVASHGLALFLSAGLASLAALPWLAALAFAALLARAAHGVSNGRAPLEPKQLGRQELGFGALVLLLLALGYGLGV